MAAEPKDPKKILSKPEQKKVETMLLTAEELRRLSGGATQSQTSADHLARRFRRLRFNDFASKRGHLCKNAFGGSGLRALRPRWSSGSGTFSRGDRFRGTGPSGWRKMCYIGQPAYVFYIR